MKKKIITALVSVSLVFLAGGIYIVITIETATATLDHLIKLHQVEILREHLLLQIKRVQSDLNLWGTTHARGIDTIIANVERLDTVSPTCFDCHHAPIVVERLKGDPKLDGMLVTRKGQRLSVQPVDKSHFKRALKLAGAKTRLR